MSVLYHLGVMQWIVRIMALGITKIMRVSGAETTSVCASVFIGQTEAPLTVRPYISKMTTNNINLINNCILYNINLNVFNYVE